MRIVQLVIVFVGTGTGYGVWVVGYWHSSCAIFHQCYDLVMCVEVAWNRTHSDTHTHTHSHAQTRIQTHT